MKFITGDIFKGKEQVFVHGCNCFNSFGAGIAFAVLHTYPRAYYDVDGLTKRGDVSKLGTYSHWVGKHRFYDQEITIVNAYTQYSFQKPQIEVSLDYDALESVMKLIRTDFSDKSIAMPRIGAGLAGGDWNRILGILETVFDGKEDVTVYSL